MDNSLTSVGKRVLTAIVAGATILSLGLAGLSLPQDASAAAAGDLIRGTSLSTVYFYGYDGERYIFPNEKTYKTWRTTFSGVQTISDSSLAAIPLGGNVVYRPGSRWIKIQSAPKTYAVSTDGNIHWIETETVATDFAGSNWNTNIDDVPDVFFEDYSVGASLMTATAFDGAMYMDGGSYYLSWDGEKRMVSSAGRTANYMNDGWFLDGANIDDSALASGSDITSRDCGLVDASQTGCDETSSTGAVTVMAASSNPASSTLPKSANGVKLFSFNVKAGSEAATVNQLTLTMGALGLTSNLSNVYLYEGEMRLTEARSVNASTRKVTFGSLDLDLAANETRTLTLRAEVASGSTVGAQVQFSLASASDVDANGGSVGGSFPVSGNTHTIGTVTVGSVTIAKNGTMTNPTIGQNDAVIGQFRLTPSSEDASVQEVTLKVDNGADHTDYKLWNDTTLLATGTYIGDKLVSFKLASPLSITEGQGKTLKVSADIGGEAADTVEVYTENDTDFLIVGGDYGFGMTINRGGYDGGDSSGAETNGTCASSSSDCSFSTIQGGDLNLAFVGPTASDIRTNSQDQVLLEFTVSATQRLTIQDLDVIVFGDDDDNDPFDGDEDGGGTGDNTGLIGASDTANITDIKIVDKATGTVVMGPLELDVTTDDDTNEADITGDTLDAEDAAQIIDFTDDFEMAAGETMTLQVLADIDNDVTSGTEFGAAVDISGLTVQDGRGDALSTSNIVPSSDITGQSQTAKSASLTVSLASTPVNPVTVQNSSNVLVNSYNVVASEAGQVTVSDLTIDIYSQDAATGTFDAGNCTSGDQCASYDVTVTDYISSCSIYVGNTIIDGPVSPTNSGANLVFDGFSWKVAAGASVQLDLKCNLANPSTTNSGYFGFTLDADSDMTAQDEDGTTVTPTGADIGGATTPASVSKVLTVDSVGTLAMGIDSSTPTPDFLLTGTSSNHVSTFRFTAAKEDFTLQTLTVSEEAAGMLTGTDASTYTNNINLVTLEYTNAAGATATTTGGFTSGYEAKFTGLSIPVTIENAAKVKVLVNVPVTDRTAGGSATSNEYVSMGLFMDTSGDDNFKAIGASSGESLNDDSGTAVSTAARFTVKETAPTFSVSASTPSGSAVPAVMEALRFNVAAAANEDVVLQELVFKLSTSDNAGSNWNQCDTDAAVGTVLDTTDFTLYKSSNLSDPIEGSDSDWELQATTGADCTTTAADAGFVTLTLGATDQIVVPKGTTATYVLYMNAVGASTAQDDILQVSIPGDYIVSSMIEIANSTNESAIAITDTTIDVDSGSAYSVGDIIAYDETDGDSGASPSSSERMLVIGISSNTLTVIRGYAGTTPVAYASLSNTNDDMYRIPGSLLWQDDGEASVWADSTDNDSYWGAYLVEGLPVTGGSFIF